MANMKAGLSLGGNTRTTRTLAEIMGTDSQIGVSEVDRYTTVWNPKGGEKGTGAFEKVSNVTPEISVELVCNEGKGYGAQVVSLDDLDDAIAALNEIEAAGFERPEGDEDSWQAPGTVIRSSWRMVHPRILVRKEGKLVAERDTSKPKDVVSFRTRNGRGAKPVEVHRSELNQVIALLTNVPSIVEGNEDELWNQYRGVKEREATAAREAALEAAKLNGLVEDETEPDEEIEEIEDDNDDNE